MFDVWDSPAQSAPTIPARTWAHPLSPGERGTIETLQVMAELVRRDAEIPVAAMWVNAIRSSARNEGEFVARCFLLARDWIVFEDDPQPYEMVTDFERMLERRRGDCDDKVIFLCTLLRAGGVPCRFVIQSYSGDEWNHVYAEAFTGGDWLALDPAADGHKGTVAHPGWRQPVPAGGKEARFEIDC